MTINYFSQTEINDLAKLFMRKRLTGCISTATVPDFNPTTLSRFFTVARQYAIFTRFRLPQIYNLYLNSQNIYNRLLFHINI